MATDIYTQQIKIINLKNQKCDHRHVQQNVDTHPYVSLNLQIWEFIKLSKYVKAKRKQTPIFKFARGCLGHEVLNKVKHLKSMERVAWTICFFQYVTQETVFLQ